MAAYNDQRFARVRVDPVCQLRMREVKMRRTRIGRVLGPGRWRGLRVGTAALAALGVVGALSPAVASASPPQQPLNWTKLTTPVRPFARIGQSMAYDGATGTVVLFGGAPSGCCLGDTWTWNGTTWTKQTPATSPPARTLAAMAYDAATGTVVLFGGTNHHGASLGDTWTWNGTTWTKQTPATSPPARSQAMMTYDAATGTVVLFGGIGRFGDLGDTWTWDGTTWTEQHPATSPPARDSATMTYDAATGSVVLFSGQFKLDDTWTWDGTTWTKQTPATSPPGRYLAYMAYDAATGTVVLYGGAVRGTGNLCYLGRTWTWDGTTWTAQTPAAHPSARAEGAMVYDAATGTVVLFGGTGYTTTRCSGSGAVLFEQTWTWG
jgi:hypothetical protein